MKPEEKAAERICSGVGEMFGEESMTAQIIAEEFKAERALSKKLLEALEHCEPSDCVGCEDLGCDKCATDAIHTALIAKAREVVI